MDFIREEPHRLAKDAPILLLYFDEIIETRVLSRWHVGVTFVCLVSEGRV